MAVRAALAGWREVEDGAVGSQGASVAGDLADVVSGIGEVADWLACRNCEKRS